MNRTTLVIIEVLVVSLGLSGGPGTYALAADQLTGRLVDSACYAKNKANIGMAHEGMGRVCAESCAREGFPVWLVTADGTAYQFEGDLASDSNAKLLPYMSHTVTLMGDVDKKDGRLIIRSAEIKIIKK